MYQSVRIHTTLESSWRFVLLSQSMSFAWQQGPQGQRHWRAMGAENAQGKGSSVGYTQDA